MAREHHRDLLILARALVKNEHAAYDIVQESFVAAWKSMDRFDISRDFGAWMRGVVRNKWREYLRKNQREIHVDDEILELMENDLIDWQSIRQDGGPTIFIRLETCLSKLPQPMAEAIHTFYNDHLSTEQTAEKLGVSGAAIRKRLERARTNLRDCLNGII